MTIVTSEYEFAHGRKPRGKALWAFEFTAGGERSMPWFVPGRLTYAEAKRLAVAEAKRRGALKIHVCS